MRLFYVKNTLHHPGVLNTTNQVLMRFSRLPSWRPGKIQEYHFHISLWWCRTPAVTTSSPQLLSPWRQAGVKQETFWWDASKREVWKNVREQCQENENVWQDEKRWATAADRDYLSVGLIPYFIYDKLNARMFRWTCVRTSIKTFHYQASIH